MSIIRSDDAYDDASRESYEPHSINMRESHFNSGMFDGDDLEGEESDDPSENDEILVNPVEDRGTPSTVAHHRSGARISLLLISLLLCIIGGSSLYFYSRTASSHTDLNPHQLMQKGGNAISPRLLLQQCQSQQKTAQHSPKLGQRPPLPIETDDSTRIPDLTQLLSLVNCPRGSFLLELSGLCTLCPRNYSTPTGCPTPTFNDIQLASPGCESIAHPESCSACSLGSKDRVWHSSETEAQKQCVCPPGYHLDSDALRVWQTWRRHQSDEELVRELSSSCTACPSAMYSTAKNSFSCAPCPFQAMTPRPGATECTACPKGQVASTTGDACVPEQQQSGCAVTPDQVGSAASLPLGGVLHVILPVSNAASYIHRWKNALEFIQRMERTKHVLLYVVELAYGNQTFHVTRADNSRHLQLRTEYPLFHKENLINIGINKLLPQDWQAVAWIDADVEFIDDAAEKESSSSSSSWPLRTLSLLDSCKDIVQLASHIVEMGPNLDSIDVRASFGFRFHQDRHPQRGQILFHPGFAWAASRKAIETMGGGLFETNIISGSDLIMAYALLNIAQCGVARCEEDFPAYNQKVNAFVARVKNLRLGYLPGALVHHFHGERTNRGYQSVWYSMSQFEPDSFFEHDEQGVIVPTEACPQNLLENMKLHFMNRKEDANGGEPVDLDDPKASEGKLAVNLRVATTAKTGGSGSSPVPPHSESTVYTPTTPTTVAHSQLLKSFPTQLVKTLYFDRIKIPVEECTRPLHYYWPLTSNNPVPVEAHAFSCRPPRPPEEVVAHMFDPPELTNMLPLPGKDKMESKFRNTSGLLSVEDFAVSLPMPAKAVCAPPVEMFTRLHEELKLFAKQQQHSPGWHESRQHVVDVLNGRAKILFGPAGAVEAFGSFATGLSTHDSDLDLKLVADCTHSNATCRRAKLEILMDDMVSGNFLGNLIDLKLISWSIPVLRFKAVVNIFNNDFVVSVDVSTNNNMGTTTSIFMREMNKLYPAFRPLSLFLKMMNHAHALKSDTHVHGGMAGYQLQVLLLFHIQSQARLQADRDEKAKAFLKSSTQPTSSSSSSSDRPSISATSTDATSVFDAPVEELPRTLHLGYLLYTFFELYGMTFRYATYGLRVRNPIDPLSDTSCFLKPSTTDRWDINRPFFLSFDDSVSNDYNAGLSVGRIRNVAKLYAFARDLLAEFPVGPDQPQPPTAGQSSSDHIAPLLNQLPGSSVMLASLLRVPLRYSVEQIEQLAKKEPRWKSIVTKYRYEQEENSKAISEDHPHSTPKQSIQSTKP